MKKARQTSYTRQPEAFTLLEILFSLALIVSVILLLTLASNGALEQSRSLRCLQNLRQIGVATRLYCNEHNNQLLLYRFTPGVDGKPGTESVWTDMMKAYELDRKKDCTCPSLPSPNSAYTTYGRRSIEDIDKTFYTKGYQGQVLGGEDVLHLSRVPSPGTFILYADSVYPLNGGSRAGKQAYGFRLDAVKSGVSGVHVRHNGKANVCFLDSHVESLRPEDLAAIKVLSGYDQDVSPQRW